MPTKEDIKFSVLIPVYNVEKYIDDCIKSVVEQTYTNFEVILVDDGSTDNSGVICDLYAAKNQKIKMLHKGNGGLLSARRTGIELASGEFYIFVDSDDMLAQNALETIYDTIKKYQCDCVIYDMNRLVGSRIMPSKNRETEKVVTDKRELYRKCFFSSSYNSLCRKAVRASVFQGLDYSLYYHICHGEDLLQSIEILKHSNSVVFIPDSLYFYRMNSNSITHTEIKYEEFKIDFTVRKMVLDLLTEEGVFKEQDYYEYRGFCIKMFVHHTLKVVSNFSTTYQNKKKLFEDIRNESYYYGFLAADRYDRKQAGCWFVPFDLFRHGYDKTVIRIFRLYKKLSKLKRYLKC